MWGDPERASSLDPSDSLSTLLLQVTGPAHIPWNDPRWQELLHGYDVWVHLESAQPVVHAACNSMAKHAATSSNLAALCLHLTRMLQDLTQATSVPSATENETVTRSVKKSMAFTERIALVGKARATAGAVHLSSLLIHSVLLQTSQEDLSDAFFYRSRDITERHRKDRPAGFDLLNALLVFVSSMGAASAGEQQTPNTPEVYDATCFCLELLVIMLSTQLYQPMRSSIQRIQSSSQTGNFMLDHLMQEAVNNRKHQRDKNFHESSLAEPPPKEEKRSTTSNVTSTDQPVPWTPQAFLHACLSWQIHRPAAPERSIAHHHTQLAQSVVQAKGEKLAPDGMYETHKVVMAAKPKIQSQAVTTDMQQAIITRPPSRIILDATRGVLVLSSSLILLPFRLMSLAFGLWGHGLHHHRSNGYDHTKRLQLQSTVGKRRRTNDVLWLTDSPVADLGGALFLLLTHNYRAHGGLDSSNEFIGNPFRAELAGLSDSRWEPEGLEYVGDSDLVGFSSQTNGDEPTLEREPSTLSTHLLTTHATVPRQILTTNFEALFESFASILHTEMGALLLYTTLQVSPIFASFLAVRSDLDTLVLPLIRTLYFASALRHYSPLGITTGNVNRNLPLEDSSQRQSAGGQTSYATALSLRSCPFRSQSQLYVILILLLLFSQDPSFGPDAFRRSIVPTVPWYKERNLKDINMGSLLLLTLLRSITFNLNKLHDAFLLSNCCAVLMNLSPNIVNVHEYAGMRLASVTVSCLKRYTSLVAKNGGNVEGEEDMTSTLGMYGEASRTLLRLLRHCIGPKNIDRNLHLVYALVYHQADFHGVLSKKPCPFGKSEVSRLQTVILTAAAIIQEYGEARTAPKALQILEESMERLQSAVSNNVPKEDFTFTYEEEADPEIFFIPYIWEVIVCVVTASNVEWDTNQIQVFPLLEEEPDEQTIAAGSGSSTTTAGFSNDVSDVV